MTETRHSRRRVSSAAAAIVALIALPVGLFITGSSAWGQSKQKSQKPAPPRELTSAEQAAEAKAARRVVLPNELLGQLDGNPILFTVMAAINAAGYDTDVDSPTNSPLRKAVRDYLAQQNIPSLPELKRYFRDHRPGANVTPASRVASPDAPIGKVASNDEANLGQYITFALMSKGAPDFGPAQPNYPMPKDAESIRDFAPLLAAFYREANIAALWQQAQPYYQEALGKYTDAVANAVLQVDAFLRVQQNNASHSRFQIFLDLLGAPNQVQTRLLIDQYYVIVTPSAELRIDEIRHQYLHSQSDSLGFKYIAELNRIKPLHDYALASPVLEQQFRDDFQLFATECFIKAAEARIKRQPADVEQAKREGFVLTPAFYDQISAYEKQPSIMRLYFGDMVKAINIQTEAKRLDKIDFVDKPNVKTIKVTVQVKPPALTGVAKTLDDAEELIRKDSARAKDLYNGVLASQPDNSFRARAIYGLARVALADRDPESADGLFRKVLETEPDTSTKAWSLLYLGKLADSQGEKEPAKEFYRQALAVAGLPEQVRREADQGMNGAYFHERKQEPEEQ
ncbi:MAG: hypothetical protein ABI824_04575 [Acidobacteriota bacterium]